MAVHKPSAISENIALMTSLHILDGHGLPLCAKRLQQASRIRTVESKRRKSPRRGSEGRLRANDDLHSLSPGIGEAMLVCFLDCDIFHNSWFIA